ncbi:MAG: hypothetical protein WCJ30_24175 [Deltaproteobacteria bacterium]
MSSRERVLRAFDRVPSDRVPVDYVANLGIDKRMKAHFKLDATDDEGLLQALSVDFRNLSVPYVGPRLHPEGPEGIVVVLLPEGSSIDLLDTSRRTHACHERARRNVRSGARARLAARGTRGCMFCRADSIDKARILRRRPRIDP